MPTYEYQCSRGHVFEVVQRMSDDPLTRCKICRAKAQRLISAANFILKGSGWYADGYSSPPNNPKKGSSESPDSPESSREGAESSPRSPSD